MKAYVQNCSYGFLVMDGEDPSRPLFFIEKKPSVLKEVFLSLKKEEFSEGLEEVLIELKEKGIEELIVQKKGWESPAIRSECEKRDLKVLVKEEYEVFKSIRSNLLNHLITLGHRLSYSDLLLRTKNLSETMIQAEISERSTLHDFHIKQAVESITDIDRSINFFTSRIREWYGLHFPELTDKLISDNQTFTELVYKLGHRKNFTRSTLIETLKIDKKKAETIEARASRSMGGELTERDLKIIRDLAERILSLYSYRKELEEYIEETMKEVAPNLSAVFGAPIASKLIALAGSLENLAMMPSSRIQVLGAEKALFKALKAGTDTPKYGVLFQWHKIRSEKAYIRGKIARMVAAKASILAKVDFYKGDFIGDKMKQEIDKKIALIKKNTPQKKKKKKKSPSAQSQASHSAKKKKSGYKKGKKTHKNKKRVKKKNR